MRSLTSYDEIDYPPDESEAEESLHVK